MDIVVPALSSGDILALRIENGALAWSDNLARSTRLGGLIGLSDIRALPILDQNMVIAISYGGKMAAIDKRTGNRLWQKNISGVETPWVAGDIVYVPSNCKHSGKALTQCLLMDVFSPTRDEYK